MQLNSLVEGAGQMIKVSNFLTLFQSSSNLDQKQKRKDQNHMQAAEQDFVEMSTTNHTYEN